MTSERAEAAVDREARIGLNEAMFREVNDRLRGLNETFATLTDKVDLVCECGDRACVQRIEMPPSAYEALRADPMLFAVVPGHEAADVEEVIEHHGAYDIVRKYGERSQQIAEATDPRSGV